MQRNKIDRTKVLAALNTICPACGFSISPAKVVRIDSERMGCPKCRHVFDYLTRGSAATGHALTAKELSLISFVAHPLLLRLSSDRVNNGHSPLIADISWKSIPLDSRTNPK